MAAAGLTPTSYIQHHLHNLTGQVGEGGAFWTIHVDTLVTSLLMGVLMVGMVWMANRQPTADVPGNWHPFVVFLLEFVERQAKDTYCGPSKLVRPIAITLSFFILL